MLAIGIGWCLRLERPVEALQPHFHPSNAFKVIYYYIISFRFKNRRLKENIMLQPGERRRPLASGWRSETAESLWKNGSKRQGNGCDEEEMWNKRREKMDRKMENDVLRWCVFRLAPNKRFQPTMETPDRQKVAVNTMAKLSRKLIYRPEMLLNFNLMWKRISKKFFAEIYGQTT